MLVRRVVRAHAARRLFRPLLITSFGAAIAGVAVWSAAGMVAIGDATGRTYLVAPQFSSVAGMPARLLDDPIGTGKGARLSVSAVSLSTGERDVTIASAPAGSERFDEVVKQAGLTSEKLASLFKSSNSDKSDRLAARPNAPAKERLAALPVGSQDRPPILLAYADPSPGAAGAALSSLLAAPLKEEDATESQDFETEVLAVPDYEDTPSDAPLPELRPRNEQLRKPAAEAEKADTRPTDAPEKPKTEEARKAEEPEARKPQKLAYARPDNPTETGAGNTFGQALRNLFGGGTKAGNGVAVYDITAARVYMPDGSVLEAHSGIGKMADNPRYANVKMTGPTPPHTYNLKMREKRFHGVEAIRMLPVDGKNKHGRDGFLTHSYLLRGGRAESHGCVAFRDYDRFLTAFKQGKIRQLVVVPSGGRATVRVASNGRSS